MRPESFLKNRITRRAASVFAFLLLLAGLVPSLHFSWQASSGGQAVREWTFGIISPLVYTHQNGTGSLAEIHWQNVNVAFNPLSWAALFVVLGLGIYFLCRSVRTNR